jgi:hypothetical protein
MTAFNNSATLRDGDTMILALTRQDVKRRWCYVVVVVVVVVVGGWAETENPSFLKQSHVNSI